MNPVHLSRQLMPTYEYECNSCGHQFETVQSMKDPHLTACPQPNCAGPLRRKIGRGAGIIFKGSGFYQTDYRSESYKAAEKSDSAASSGSGGGGAAATPPPAAAPAAAPAPVSSPST